MAEKGFLKSVELGNNKFIEVRYGICTNFNIDFYYTETD